MVLIVFGTPVTGFLPSIPFYQVLSGGIIVADFAVGYIRCPHCFPVDHRFEIDVRLTPIVVLLDPRRDIGVQKSSGNTSIVQSDQVPRAQREQESVHSMSHSTAVTRWNTTIPTIKTTMKYPAAPTKFQMSKPSVKAASIVAFVVK